MDTLRKLFDLSGRVALITGGSRGLGLQIADQPNANLVLIDERRAAAEVERDNGQRFVHGQHEIAGAIDAFSIAQSFRDQLPEHYADIFDGVMLIDIEVTGGLECEIESAMLGKELQHVIEKANAAADVVRAAAFDAQPAGYLCFFGVALDAGFSHWTLV